MLLLFIIWGSITSAFAQIKDTSKLYYASGVLKADTTIKINKTLLDNWTTLEDTFINSILSRIEYNRILFDNDISGKIVVSFTIDEKGNPNSFNIEKEHTDIRRYETKIFSSAVIKAILLTPFQLSLPFKSVAANKSNRYYLPVSFVISDVEIKDVSNGWIRYCPKLIINY